MTINWWTLGIQTVNVVVLVWLLQRFFWRPVSAMIEQRRTAVQGAVSDAQAGRAKAATALADIARTRAGFAAEHDKIVGDAHKAAEAAGAASASEAAKQAASLLAAAKVEIGHQRHDAEAAWAGHASELAVDIAGRLATRLDSAAIRATFLDWLVEAIGKLPAQERLDAVAHGASLEARSATALDPADQEHAGALIGQAFGACPPIAFKVDPTLIAGLELHGDHLSVGNSWRADLAAILAGLSHAA